MFSNNHVFNRKISLNSVQQKCPPSLGFLLVQLIIYCAMADDGSKLTKLLFYETSRCFELSYCNVTRIRGLNCRILSDGNEELVRVYGLVSD